MNEFHFYKFRLRWPSCFLQWVLNNPNARFVPSLFSPSNSYLILNPHPVSEAGKRTGWKEERWCQFCTLFYNKTRTTWCLLWRCIKIAVSKHPLVKCHSCSWRVCNQVGRAVSQLKGLSEHEVYRHTVHCTLPRDPRCALRISKSHVTSKNTPH